MFFCLVLQLEDLAKVSIKGQVVQAAKIPTSNAYRRGDTPGSRSRYVGYFLYLVVVGVQRHNNLLASSTRCCRRHKGYRYLVARGQHCEVKRTRESQTIAVAVNLFAPQTAG